MSSESHKHVWISPAVNFTQLRTTSHMHSGQLYIVSAPSGAGKTSLLKQLISSLSNIKLSISHTTRQPRLGENDGEHYIFTDQERFNEFIQQKQFLEYAQVFDHFYGTSKDVVNTMLESGHDVILEIDWQGAAQIRKLMPESKSIFILPPSYQALEERLKNRQQDSDEVIQRRLKDAVADMQHHEEFDYIVFNDDFDVALDELRCIFTANRLQKKQQIHNCQHQLKQLCDPESEATKTCNH